MNVRSEFRAPENTHPCGRLLRKEKGKFRPVLFLGDTAFHRTLEMLPSVTWATPERYS